MISSTSALPRSILFFAGKRNQRDISAALHGHRDFPLVPGAVSRNAARKNFPALGQKEPQRLDVLVINERRLVNAEAADFFSDLKTSSFVRASAVPGVPASRIGGPV
jgi:hypothetical protein